MDYIKQIHAKIPHDCHHSQEDSCFFYETIQRIVSEYERIKETEFVNGMFKEERPPMPKEKLNRVNIVPNPPGTVSHPDRRFPNN